MPHVGERGLSVRVFPTAMVAALMVGLSAAPAAAAGTIQRLIVGITDGADPAAVAGDAAWHRVDGLGAITVDVPAEQVAAAQARWATDPAVRYSAPDSTVHADEGPADPVNNVVLNPFRVPGAQTWTTGSPSIVVAVVDTGVTANDDLPAARIVAGHDFADGDSDPVDDDNHGTVVANAIAAAGGNDIGGTGVCSQCRIMPVRVLRHVAANKPATGYASDVAAGIVWAADHGAKIVNVSASTAVAVPLLRAAVAYAASKNVLVVASAGHDPTTHYTGYPAAFESALAVGSAGSGGAPSMYTNLNTASDRWIDVAASGFIFGVGADNAEHVVKGTSAATAVVSGAAALAYAMKPDLTEAQLRDRIVGSANPAVGQPAYNPPLLDAARLVYGLGGTDTQAPTVTDDASVKNGMWLSALEATYFRPVYRDDHAVARIEYLLNGERIGEWFPYSSEVRLTNPKKLNGTYPVTTRAYDYAGNVGQRTVSIHVDTVAPTGQIASPAAGAHVRTPTSVVFYSNESDSLVKVVANGVTMDHRAGAVDWTAKVIPVTRGGTIVVQAWDHGGNQTMWTRDVVIDNAGPIAKTLTPGDNVRVRGTITAGISGVTDASGVAGAELWVNGVFAGVDNSAPFALPVKTAGRNGTLTLTWKLTDKLGNISTYARKVVADNTGPTVSITKAPKNKAKVKGTVKVYVSAKDAAGIARVQLLINGKVVATDSTASYVLAVNVKKVAKTMKVQVRAYDKVGNVRYTTTRVWYRK